ncbi:hypothetical protein ANN_14087 [Periplaneta americana]|uniref:Uncharacterized protein n=1 Tax=Periplaneta americana TaxID=6978 RepID=A0ABQ8SVB5_PERAM|nr:hypothetical protein ANN_14087 [Periplaneta americana]
MASSTTGTGHRRSHFSAGWGTTPLALRCQKRTEYTTSKEMDGRAGRKDLECLHWPLRSPDPTPCDFFLWGFIKQQVYQPPLPPTIEDLRVRITEAIALVDGPMLQRIWQEIDYRLDVCRVTQGAHIEHIECNIRKEEVQPKSSENEDTKAIENSISDIQEAHEEEQQRSNNVGKDRKDVASLLQEILHRPSTPKRKFKRKFMITCIAWKDLLQAKETKKKNRRKLKWKENAREKKVN